MKRPGWVIAVGIIGMIIGFFGILGSGKSIIIPLVIETQKEVLSEIDEVYEDWEERADFPEEIFEFLTKLLKLPDWFYKWSIIFGITGFFFYIFYLFAFIWLFLIKTNAVKLFYIATGLILLLSLARTITASATKSIIGFLFMSGSSLVLAINIILLIVVALSDKRAFKRQS